MQHILQEEGEGKKRQRETRPIASSPLPHVGDSYSSLSSGEEKMEERGGDEGSFSAQFEFENCQDGAETWDNDETLRPREGETEGREEGIEEEEERKEKKEEDRSEEEEKKVEKEERGVLPSLATGVVFSDEEAWESFSHGSTPSPEWGGGGRGRGEGEWSSSSSPWTSPARRQQLSGEGEREEMKGEGRTEEMEGEGRPVDGCPGVTAAPLHNQPHPQEQHLVNKQHVHNKQQEHLNDKHQQTHMPIPVERWSPTESPEAATSSFHPSPPPAVPPPVLPPPPSVLAARLFPALRQERERIVQQQKQQQIQQKQPSHQPAATPGSGEVRERLCQLETEIERFRLMNARLEDVVREREKVSGVKGDVWEVTCDGVIHGVV